MENIELQKTANEIRKGIVTPRQDIPAAPFQRQKLLLIYISKK